MSGIDRRTFLERALWLLSGVMSAVLCTPLIGYLLAPLWRRTRRPYVVRLMAEEELPLEGEVAEALYTVTFRDGWRTRREARIAYVVNLGEKLLVLSNSCTHTGCGVRWEADLGKFVCPCHGGEFDRQGRVLKQPPPRPLQQLAHQLREGALWIKVEG